MNCRNCIWTNADFLSVAPLGTHDDVIKWKHFPRYWPLVQGIHRSPVNSPHKGQWCAALMFSLICVWINYWGNNREAGDLRRYHAHYDVIVMKLQWNLKQSTAIRNQINELKNVVCKMVVILSQPLCLLGRFELSYLASKCTEIIH